MWLSPTFLGQASGQTPGALVPLHLCSGCVLCLESFPSSYKMTLYILPGPAKMLPSVGHCQVSSSDSLLASHVPTYATEVLVPSADPVNVCLSHFV
jgi:hypothetical protein